MSDNGHMFDTIKGVIRYMVKSELYDQEAMDNVQSIACVGRFSRQQQTYNPHMINSFTWIPDDLSVPKGWRVALKTEKTGQPPIISPDQQIFPNRRTALRCMVERNLPSEVIEEMRSCLNAEGWQDHSHLPFNWKLKIGKNGGKRRKLFMTEGGRMFDTSASAIRYMESAKHYTEEDISKIQSMGRRPTAVSAKNFDKDISKHDWKSDNPTLPHGWKTSTYTNPTTNKLQELFLSPDKEVFTSRRQGLRYMVAKKFPTNQIEDMRTFLSVEGWMKSDILPIGWRLKTQKRTLIMVHTGLMFASPSLVVKFMKSSNDYTSSEVEKVQSLSNTGLKREPKIPISLNAEGYTWDSEDTTIPNGWKTTVDVSRPGHKLFMSPDGLIFTKRTLALKYMVNNNLSSEMIECMRDSTIHEGWKKHPKLPDNWRVQPKRDKTGTNKGLLLLTPLGGTFESTKKALLNMKKSGKCDAGTMNLINRTNICLTTAKTEDVQVSTIFNWQSDNPTVPSGWQTAENLKMWNMVKAPDGTRFKNRRLALKDMISKSFSTEKIEEMRRCLKAEGWEDNDHLPSNWKMKLKTFTGSKYHRKLIMSPNGTVFESVVTAVKFMKASNDFTREEIENLKSISIEEKHQGIKKRKETNEQKRKEKEMLEASLQKTTWTEDDPSVPKGWKTGRDHRKPGKIVLQSPEGVQLTSRRKALLYMAENRFPVDEIEKMMVCLEQEGWQPHPDLPVGWRVKKKKKMGTTSGGVLAMNPEGIIFPSIVKALKYLKKSSKCDTETKELIMSRITKRKNTLKTKPVAKKLKGDDHIWVQDDSTLPEGWESATNPEKPGQYVFQSPAGLQFTTRSFALRHMVKSGFPSEDIEALRLCLVHEGWKMHPGLPDDLRVRARRKVNGPSRKTRTRKTRKTATHLTDLFYFR